MRKKINGLNQYINHERCTSFRSAHPIWFNGKIMAKKIRKLIGFDWAIKKILRSKANLEVIEGFLSELLFEDIKILEVADFDFGVVA